MGWLINPLWVGSYDATMIITMHFLCFHRILKIYKCSNWWNGLQFQGWKLSPHVPVSSIKHIASMLEMIIHLDLNQQYSILHINHAFRFQRQHPLIGNKLMSRMLLEWWFQGYSLYCNTSVCLGTFKASHGKCCQHSPLVHWWWCCQIMKWAIKNQVHKARMTVIRL